MDIDSDAKHRLFAKMQRERMHKMFVATLGVLPLLQAKAWTQSPHCPVIGARYREETRSVYPMPGTNTYFVMTKIASNGYMSCSGYQCDEFPTLQEAKAFATEVYDRVYSETNAKEVLPSLHLLDPLPTRLSLVAGN